MTPRKPASTVPFNGRRRPPVGTRASPGLRSAAFTGGLRALRALRGVALGRKAWLFAGSDRGGERAAFMYTLIGTAKLNDIDPQAWLADVLARLPDHPAKRIGDLLPWNWASSARIAAAA